MIYLCGFPHTLARAVWKFAPTVNLRGAMLSILRSSPLLIAVGACGVLLSTLAGGAIATSFEMNRQRTQLAADLGLRRAFLRSEIERHRLLPKTLAGDGRLWQAVDPNFSSTSRATMAVELSARFEDLARSDGAVTLYLVDRLGTTVSSSNFRLKESFVGQNYAFRSYFTDSIANGFGELFARGTVSGIPGLYLAHQLQNLAGVVVVKVEFDELERNWRETGDRTFVTDREGQVLLTSDPSIRFTHLTPIDSTTNPWVVEASADLDAPAWHLVIRRDARSAVLASRSFGWLTGGTLGGLIFLSLSVALLARQRRERTRVELERLVTSRTVELRDSNERLLQEVEERSRADARAQKLRDDLAQANRLAVLGQITAGVAHEINQPVAAIRTNVDNAKVLLSRGQAAETLDNLERVAQLTARIGLITDELREFSRRAPLERNPVRLASVVDGAILLLDSKLRAARISVRLNLSPEDPRVFANRIKLEQVVVNLVQNAVEALSDTINPIIEIETAFDDANAWFAITDNGPGVAEASLQQIFTPFNSTKPLGLGLGLVISRDIMAELGGTLDYEAVSPCGAKFIGRLPRWKIDR